MECVMASDLYEPAVRTYKHNHGMDVRGDICKIDPSTVEPYNILCAGFPCQPFSQAGFKQGFDDARGRGTMFAEVMRFVTTHTPPRVVVLENVAALLTHDSGKSFEKIKSDLEAEGYVVAYKVLKASDYALPQRRQRIFIVGIKGVSEETMEGFFDLDQYKKTVTLSEFLGKDFVKDVAYTIRVGGRGSPIDSRHNWDSYHMTDGTEYRLTISDCLRLQGFGDEFALLGTKTENFKLLGNTIPVVFSEIIGKQILKTLNGRWVADHPSHTI
jgi:DNA (cytosine-5)-methyltransferase 1